MAGLMGKAFELSVIVSAVDHLSGPMKKMESTMKYGQQQMDLVTKSMKNMGAKSSEIKKMSDALNKMARVENMGKIADDLKKIGSSDAEIQRITQGMERMASYQSKMEGLHNTMSKFKTTTMVGGAMTAGGVGMAHEILGAVDEAGKLLTIMTTIQDATGATAGQMAKIKNTITDTSAITKFDQFDVSKFAATLSTSGYNAAQTNSLLPTFTKFLEVQQYGKGANPDEMLKQSIQLAHSAGHYDPTSLMKYLDQFNRATFMQPEDSTKFGETLKYLQPTAMGLHMSDTDSLFLAALANRMGLAGSMGGTNAADMLMRSIPGISGGLQPKVKYEGSGKNKHIAAITYPKALQAMMNIGIADKNGNSSLFKNGQITNLQGFITQLYDKTKGMSPEKRYQAFHDIFGIQGARAATLLGSDKGMDQLRALVEGAKQKKSIGQFQEDYLKTPEGQINQLKSNLGNLKMNVFLEMATQLNPLLKHVNDLVTKLMAFSKQHPTIAKYVATFGLMATAALLIAGPLTSLIGLIGMIATGLRMMGISKVTGEFNLFGKALRLIFTGPFKLLRSSIKLIGPALRILALDFTPLMGVASKIGSVFVRGFAFIRPLLNGIGLGVRILISAFGNLFSAFGMVARGAGLLLIEMGPIGWAILAVVAAVGLLWVAWRNNWGHIQEHTRNAVAQLKRMWEELKAGLSKFGHDFYQMGVNMMEGLKNGIVHAYDAVKGAISSVAQGTISTFKNLLGIHSPSKVFMEHGKFITQGLALGMIQNAGMVEKASATLAGSTTDAFDGSSNVGSFTGGDTHIHVYPHPHQNVSAIADEVERRMNKRSMRMSMRSGIRLNPGTT